MNKNILIRELEESDLSTIPNSFAEIHWNKPLSQFQKYLSEQVAGSRLALVAFIDQKFAGYTTIVWHSEYPVFQENQIPEIVDLNVLPEYQKLGIGTQLLDKAESIVSERSKTVGIGLGLAPGYNAAQVMYMRRGYVPDGFGLRYNNKLVTYGETVQVDDGLVLHLVKKLS